MIGNTGLIGPYRTSNLKFSSGVFGVQETYCLNLNDKFPSATLNVSDLVLWLDPAKNLSYPGTGSVWYDLSGNNNHFNILSTAYNSTGPKYMDFNGSYGQAKIAGKADISLSDSTGITYALATRIKGSGDWRTLTRSYVGDHHVIIKNDGFEMGMYDNDGNAFYGTGYNQSSLPNYNTTNWLILFFRWQSSSPYYEMSYNDSPQTIRASLTNSNTRYNRGFGSLGGYHGESVDPSAGSQYWGDIGFFMVYNKRLTDGECLQIFNTYRHRFGL